jgi:hypothetical protein
MVPVAFVPEAPARVELIEVATIGVPAVAVVGPVTERLGLALEMDSVWVAAVNDPDEAVIFGLPAWESP